MRNKPLENQDRSVRRIKLGFPDPMVFIFLILVFTYVLGYVVPSGEFERILVDGRTRVIAGSYELLDAKPRMTPFDIFVAIPRGLVNASQYLFIVFLSGGLFHLLQRSGALENGIAVFIRSRGVSKRNSIIVAGTFVYGGFGLFVGYENNIALIPVALLIASAIGCSSLVGVAMSVGGVGVGFALSPMNPFTVGVAQQIAELELFSGFLFRAILVSVSLSLLAWYICARVTKMSFEEADDRVGLQKPLSDYVLSREDKLVLSTFVVGLLLMVFAVLRYKWYINEIAAVFLILSVIIGFITRLTPSQIAQEIVVGASKMTGGALIIGLAASIPVILNEAKIMDSVVYGLSSIVSELPVWLAAVGAAMVQGFINFFVPSGSGQALLTMPILIPVADLVGMSRQLMVSAFQVGDGITNLIIPTSGGTLAMLAIARVSYIQWLKMIFPLMLFLYLLASLALIVAYFINY